MYMVVFKLPWFLAPLELCLERPSRSSLVSEDTQRTDPMFILYLVGTIPIRHLEIKALMMGETKCCAAQ